jgi:glycosyltransferase involved in cell wall biosynthesis
VCAARLSPEKGVDVLLRAAAQLRRQVPGVHIRIYGDSQAGFDNYVAGLVGLRTALGVEDMVSFAGLVDCPYSHWSDAAVYVQPSRADSLPLAPLEAMAVGLPVVAASVGGLAEVVADGHSGTLVPPDEPEALADALAELLKDPDRAARMGAAGRQRVERLFTLDRFLDRILEVYTEVADRPPRRPQPRIRRYVLRARS